MLELHKCFGYTHQVKSPLLRLIPYIQKHALAFWSGMAGLLLARVFEATIPLLIKMGVDNIALGLE